MEEENLKEISHHYTFSKNRIRIFMPISLEQKISLTIDFLEQLPSFMFTGCHNPGCLQGESGVNSVRAEPRVVAEVVEPITYFGLQG